MHLPPFKLERYFARYEFTSRFHLAASDCESVAIADLLDLEPGAREAFLRLRLGYTESRGSPALRQEICRIYTTIGPDDLLVHSGAEEGVFLFMHAALAPGDHAVIHAPCYQALREIALGIGCDVTPWVADETRGWALSPDDLRRIIRPNTKAIILNTPHNPTGYLMSGELYREVHGIAAERGIILFSDEVYRESEYDTAQRLPAGCDVSPGAVSLGVMSKTYGLPGLRIGWVASHNRELLGMMEGLKDYTTICVGAPGEFLAELALRHRDRISGRNRDIIAGNLVLLDAFLSRYPDLFRWNCPGAGPIAFPRLLAGGVEKFCEDLVTSSSVLLLPGTVYDDTGNHFRIGFGRKNFPEAIARLEAYIRSRLA